MHELLPSKTFAPSVFPSSFSPPTRRAHSENFACQPRARFDLVGLTTGAVSADLLYKHDDERFQPPCQAGFTAQPNGKKTVPGWNVSAGLSVLADAARFPATWFCLGTLNQVAEMAVLANLCAEADTAATHQLCYSCEIATASIDNFKASHRTYPVLSLLLVEKKKKRKENGETAPATFPW